MPSLDLFRNTTPVAASGRYLILEEAELIELQGRAGHVGHLYLYEVREDGHDATFLRAVSISPDTLVVFDLRTVCADLAEITSFRPVDVPGLILHTLRANFTTAAEAMAAMVRQPLAAAQRHTSLQVAA